MQSETTDLLSGSERENHTPPAECVNGVSVCGGEVRDGSSL